MIDRIDAYAVVIIIPGLTAPKDKVRIASSKDPAAVLRHAQSGNWIYLEAKVLGWFEGGDRARDVRNAALSALETPHNRLGGEWLAVDLVDAVAALRTAVKTCRVNMMNPEKFNGLVDAKAEDLARMHAGRLDQQRKKQYSQRCREFLARVLNEEVAPA